MEYRGVIMQIIGVYVCGKVQTSKQKQDTLEYRAWKQQRQKQANPRIYANTPVRKSKHGLGIYISTQKALNFPDEVVHIWY